MVYTDSNKNGVIDIDQGEITEENHYYAFGMKQKTDNDLAGSGYKYKFGGKEWDSSLGLDLYDFGARNYDPTIGRWMNVDPLAEQYFNTNPYGYALNNPIYFVDPDGMQSLSFSEQAAQVFVRDLQRQLAADDWIKNDQTGQYIWNNKVTFESNIPKGFSYVGKEDQSIIKDLGWNADYKSLTTKKMGRVVLDQNSAGITTVTANSNIRVNANVTTKIDSKTGIINKIFNGVDIGVGVKGTGTGTESIGVTGLATTTFGGKDYTVGLRDVRFNKSSQITQNNTSNIYGDLFILAKDIYSISGLKHFPGVNIKGGWINVKSDGSGAVPVSRFLVFPLEYNHTYNPFSPK